LTHTHKTSNFGSVSSGVIAGIVGSSGSACGGSGGTGGARGGGGGNGGLAAGSRGMAAMGIPTLFKKLTKFTRGFKIKEPVSRKRMEKVEEM